MSKHYEIFDRKVALKKGLNKAYLRSVPTLKLAKIFTGKDELSYIIKKSK